MTGNYTPYSLGQFSDPNVKKQVFIRIAIFLAIMAGIYFAYKYFYNEPVIQEVKQSVVSTISRSGELERFGFSNKSKDSKKDIVADKLDKVLK